MGDDVATVSSEVLGEIAGVNAAKVRKDLSHLGSLGTRGSGYDVEALLARIRAELGLTREWPVVIAGLGNLGRALALYGGLPARGFRIVALLDADPSKVGTDIGGVTVSHASELEEVVRSTAPAIGVVATPAEVAQDVTERLVATGVTSLLNFAPVTLSVPDWVDLRQVDLSTELQILAFYQRERDDTSLGVPEPQDPVAG